MEYRVNYTEVFTGQYLIEAESEEEAMDKVSELIDSGELVPSENYDGHEITVDLAEEA